MSLPVVQETYCALSFKKDGCLREFYDREQPLTDILRQCLLLAGGEKADLESYIYAELSQK